MTFIIYMRPNYLRKNHVFQAGSITKLLKQRYCFVSNLDKFSYDLEKCQ